MGFFNFKRKQTDVKLINKPLLDLINATLLHPERLKFEEKVMLVSEMPAAKCFICAGDFKTIENFCKALFGTTCSIEDDCEVVSDNKVIFKYDVDPGLRKNAFFVMPYSDPEKMEILRIS